MDNLSLHQLPNGLGVIVLEDPALPIVCATIWYRVGARGERAGQTGLSHFLEHMMFKGSGRFPKGAVDDISLRLGGHNNAFTTNDCTCYYMTFSADRWAIALDIEADRMCNLRLEPDEFAAEQQVVLEELKMGEDQPWEFLRRNVQALAWRSHPYRNPIIGWPEDVAAVTVDDMRRHYEAHYHPGNAFLVVTGAVTAAEVLDRATASFGDIPARPRAETPVTPDPPLDGLIRFRARRPSRVSRLLVAFRGPSGRHPDQYAADLLRYVLTEGKTSRLHQRLVERDRLATSLSAHVDNLIDPGLITVGLQLREGVDPARAEGALWDELRRLRAEGVEPAALARARRQLEADFVFEREDISALAVDLGIHECLDSCRRYTEYLDRVRRLEAADLQRCAETYLDPDRCVVGLLEGGGLIDGLEASADTAPPTVGPGRAYRQRPPARHRRRPTGSERPGPTVHLPARTHRLPNGLRLLLCPFPRVPAVVAAAHVSGGSRTLAPEQAGLASLLGQMLDEGTHRRDHQAIAAWADDRGAELDTFGGREGFGIVLRTLTPDLAEGLDLIQDLAYGSTLPADRLEVVRERALTQLAAAEDRADYLGARAFKRLIYEGTPLAQPTSGTRASVRELAREALATHHRRHFVPANTLLVITGDIDPDRVLEQVARSWGELPPGDPPPSPEYTFQRRDRTVGERVPAPDKEQTHLFLGHLGIRRSDPDFYRLLVMDIILGAGPGFTSRIPRRLRDELGLAYHTSAGITGSAGLDPGQFLAYIGTSPRHRDLAIREMLKEIRRMRRHRVAPAELTGARDYLTGSFVFHFQTMSQVASFLIRAELHGLGFDYPARFASLIGSVSADDILEAARRHLDPDRYILAEAGAGNEESLSPVSR